MVPALKVGSTRVVTEADSVRRVVAISVTQTAEGRRQ
jgi:hypothetical protein